MNSHEDTVDDETLIRAVIAGDGDQFRHLVSRHKNLVFAMILRQVGHRETAEDLAQDTFVKAYRSLRGFRFESAFSSWLVRIALNTTNSYFTSKRYKQMKKNVELEAQPRPDTTESPEELRIRQERITLFRDAFAELKREFREVITLCSLEGKSYEEAASIIGIPVGTVRSRLNHARLHLKKNFELREESLS